MASPWVLLHDLVDTLPKCAHWGGVKCYATATKSDRQGICYYCDQHGEGYPDLRYAAALRSALGALEKPRSSESV